jgi:amidophosphoribosyltransferase
MCGVVGIIGSPDAAREAFLGLTTLQHRGQDAAGMLSYQEGADRPGFHCVKNLGLVESVFHKENIESLKGDMSIAHARYSTSGRGEVVDVQPFLINYPFGIGLVHNGNLINTEELRALLLNKYRRHLLTQSDSEILLNLIAEGLSQVSQGVDFKKLKSEQVFEKITEALKPLYEIVNGSFSVVCMIAGHGLLAFRDAHGIKPLVWGKRSGSQMVASESVALTFSGYDVVRDIAPGEVLWIDTQGISHTKVMSAKPFRPCMFEWVYFASPESELDQIPVYGARIGLGQFLASQVQKVLAERGFVADIVVPVPETSRIAAIALSEKLKIPYREVLIKNRYIKRTFIMDSQDKRQSAVNLKLSPVRSEIKGKKVLLVDDSIVRGTTSKKLIELVRSAGAEKVYFVSTCPPIKNPCYYGIDFPNGKELIAHDKDYKEIEKELGADALIYMDLEGLKAAILSALKSSKPELLQNGLVPCMACLDGKYPTDVSQGQVLTDARIRDRASPQSKGLSS